MTKAEKIFLVVVGLCICADIIGKTWADSGYEAATRIERGSYIDIRVVSVSSTTGATLMSASVKRPDSICYNNSASTVFIGTTSATMDAVTHSNITNGFPITSSATFKLDGSMSGNVYATADIGVASVNVRCIDGLVR